MTHVIGRGRYKSETYPQRPSSSAAGGGAIVRMGFDNPTDPFRYNVIGNFTPMLRTGTTPLSVPLTGFKPGNLILIQFSVSPQDGVASGPDNAAADFVPTIDLGAGPRTVHSPEIGTNGNALMPGLTWGCRRHPRSRRRYCRSDRWAPHQFERA